MHLLKRYSEATALFVIAALLVGATEFSLRSYILTSQMNHQFGFIEHRRQACLELKWRWEADDQQHQYRAGSSAGTHQTVGPIAGYVMDVTENEYGHAVGQCHEENASYIDLLSQE